MKTVQDLVNKLNKISLPVDEFSMSLEQNDCYIRLGRTPIVVFILSDKKYSFCPFINYARYEEQDLIVKYLANHTPDDWFQDAKE